VSRNSGLKCVEHLRTEAGKDDLFDRLVTGQEVPDASGSDARRVGDRIAVDAATDRRERYRLHRMGNGEFQRIPETACQQFRLTVLAVPVLWPDRMDHIPGGKPISRRDPSLTGWATTERPAFPQQIGPGSAVDGPIDPAAAQQRLVRGIDDGVNGQGGDIGLLDNDPRHTGLSWRRRHALRDDGA
jgi:hypothetical protein